MKIEFNKVTWYSKLLAIIIYVGTFFLGYWLGQINEGSLCAIQDYEKQSQIIQASLGAQWGRVGLVVANPMDSPKQGEIIQHAFISDFVW